MRSPVTDKRNVLGPRLSFLVGRQVIRDDLVPFGARSSTGQRLYVNKDGCPPPFGVIKPNP